MQRVADEDRHRLVPFLVHGRLAAAQIVVVHRRQVVMHEAVGVDRLDRGGGEARGALRHAEDTRAFEHEKATQPLAAAHGVGHRLGHRAGRGQGFGQAGTGGGGRFRQAFGKHLQTFDGRGAGGGAVGVEGDRGDLFLGFLELDLAARFQIRAT